jgi:N-acetyl-gamma-glutamyl-phosphate reductase
MTTPVAVVGASGYSGAELVQLLLAHPAMRIAGLFGSGKVDASGKPPAYSQTFGRFRGQLDLPVLASDPQTIANTGAKLAFLCTPHEASIPLAKKLLDLGVGVLDLSAAFRLRDASAYPAYYGFTHEHPELLAHAAYGLAECFAEEIAKASLTAVAGCYPTSAILPLRPLAAAGAIAPHTRIIIDSTSGISGAGRKAEQRLLLCEVSQQAYGVFTHRHQPEIDAFVGKETIFTPHTGPYDRGILSTIHIDLAKGWNEARVRECLHNAYGSQPFVRLCAPGVWPGVVDVRGTNFCDIALAVKGDHCIISSALDNLIKGAAGQAVQCANLRLGLPQTTGLLASAKSGGHA